MVTCHTDPYDYTATKDMDLQGKLTPNISKQYRLSGHPQLFANAVWTLNECLTGTGSTSLT